VGQVSRSDPARSLRGEKPRLSLRGSRASTPFSYHGQLSRVLDMHRLLVIGLALILGSSVPANAQLASGAPDLVLGNGHIFTGAEGKPWVEAVSIKGDRVVAAGTDAAVSATADQHTKIIDLGGRMAMPGINDAPEHVGGASFGLQVLFSPGHGPHGPGPEPSVAELADAVRSAALTARTGGGFMPR